MRPGRRFVMAVAALALVIAAFVSGRASNSSTAAASPVATREIPIPAADAPAFAVEAVRELNSPRMVDGAYRTVTLSRFLDPAANRLADRFVPGPGFEAATGLAADRSAGRATVAQVVPVAVASTSQGPDDARVSVWAVSVVGTQRLGQLVASWSTETLTLRRANGGWRVVGYRSSPGPVPAATQPPTDVSSALRAVSAMKTADDER